jgi:predicted ArsR family transcriptional regulator
MPEPAVSPAGMRIVKLLVGRPPQTVADLIGVASVTRTAVTEQLNELVAAGFVERTTQRLPGRGRPRHLYSTTPAALVLLFAGNQQLVVPAIWRAIEEVGGNELRRKVVKRVSRFLAEHYRRRVRGASPRQRLSQLCAVLREEGVLVEMESSNGRLAIRKRSCPFISMYEESQTICSVDQEVISAVVGAPVRRTEYRHGGDPCCTFELDVSRRR